VPDVEMYSVGFEYSGCGKADMGRGREFDGIRMPCRREDFECGLSTADVNNSVGWRASSVLAAVSDKGGRIFGDERAAAVVPSNERNFICDFFKSS
jgi:hypothetical protein